MSASHAGRRGFTMLEVVLILLVVVLGMLGVIGLTSYGMAQASKAQGRSLGMATAISVANDGPQALAPAGMWTYAPIDLNDAAGNQKATSTGFINGFYVTRTETSLPADIAAQTGGTVYVRRCAVAVDVYDGLKGSLIVSFNTQIVRQRGVQ